MDITTIPPTVFIAFGVITAALIAGFFSYTNMVSAKENKVSEFRLAWIDGLRNEIAEYTSAAQDLSRAYKKTSLKGDDIFKETKDSYTKAVENLTKIQLRLNPDHVKKNPDSPEAKLMTAVTKARTVGNKEFKDILACCDEIREAAAPILKSTWNSVKKGETGYRLVRGLSLSIVIIGAISISAFGTFIAANVPANSSTQSTAEGQQGISNAKPNNPSKAREGENNQPKKS